jgi:hydrogenase maturation protease
LNADTLIIGYGNPARADDGFGYRAAERIPGAVAVQQLTPELMESIAHADRVIFLDAAAEGAPGELRRRAISPRSTAPAFTHHATPEALLAGALALYARAPEAEIITVCGADWSVSERLSPAVARALEVVVTECRARMRCSKLVL